MSMKMLDLVTALVLIGAGVHLGLTALNYDLVGMAPINDMMRKVVFGLVGVAAVYRFAFARSIRKRTRA